MKLTIPNLWEANTITDIAKVKATYPAVILRVGYGGEIDKKFVENYKICTDAGMPVCVFYFPLDKYTPKQMVDKCFGWMAGMTIHFLAPDVEHPLPGYGNTLSKATVDGFIAEWRSRVTLPVIYSSQARWYEIMQNSTQYADCVKWVSNPGSDYPAMPDKWGSWGLWQFAFNREVEGITGGVDLNYFHSEELAKLTPFTFPLPSPIPMPEEPLVLWQGKVNGTAGLYVRNMPSKSGRVLRGLVYGTEVDVYQVQDSWARISPDKPEWCYIAPDCLVRIVDVPPPPPPVIVVPPSSGSAIDIESFPRFSQRDPRWANDRLGTSDSSMGGWGCLVTANATVYKYLGIDIDPGRLNKLMISWNGYEATNLWRWWTPTLYLPVKWEREPAGTTARARIDLVRSLTERGIPPILCVDFNLAQTDLQSHFVVGLGVTADKDIIIMDTWDGTVKLFSKEFGNPLWGIWRVDTYTRKEE